MAIWSNVEKKGTDHGRYTTDRSALLRKIAYFSRDSDYSLLLLLEFGQTVQA